MMSAMLQHGLCDQTLERPPLAENANADVLVPSGSQPFPHVLENQLIRCQERSYESAQGH